MPGKASRPFDATRTKFLKDPIIAAGYLMDCLADGNLALFTESLRQVAEARLGGMSELARKTKLGRETLYRTLSKDGNPRLDTLYKILDAMGLKLAFDVQKKK